MRFRSRPMRTMSECPNCGFQLTPSNMSRAHRLPADWHPAVDMAVWARKERPDVDLALEVAKFRDYWTSKSGKDAAKLDWFATWRNWIRSAPASKTSPKPASHAPAKRDDAPKLTQEQREANHARLSEMLAGAIK